MKARTKTLLSFKGKPNCNLILLDPSDQLAGSSSAFLYCVIVATRVQGSVAETTATTTSLPDPLANWFLLKESLHSF
jgi:hypothetical protein